MQLFQLRVPVKGHFTDGVGSFYAEVTLNDVAIKVRFLWSRSDADTLRWEQAFSYDAGATSTMVFSRAELT